PDKNGYIITKLILNNPHSLKTDRITISNSKGSTIAEIFIDKNIKVLDIAFRIKKKDYGEIYIKELHDLKIGFITTEEKLKSTIFLKDDILKSGRNLYFLQNSFSRAVIDIEHGSVIKNISTDDNAPFDFFSFYPLYGREGRVRLQNIELGLTGKDIPSASGKKFKLKNLKKETPEFTFEKKGFKYLNTFSFIKDTPILKQRLEIEYSKKKELEGNMFFKSLLYYGKRRNSGEFLYNDLGKFVKLYYPNLERFWNGLKYYKTLPIYYAFLNPGTKNIIIQFMKTDKAGEFVVNTEDDCMILTGTGPSKKFKKGSKFNTELFTLMGKLIHFDDRMFILNKGFKKSSIIYFNFKRSNRNLPKVKFFQNGHEKRLKHINLFKGLQLSSVVFPTPDLRDKDTYLLIGKKKIQVG
ncbi:hypothetical protein KAU33_12710, partial [Candidatus Dependentiae bacterium]|nr:hypothetical protein [Candidatus Dependentiae bacterium]